MNNLINIVKNWSIYKNWKAIKNGKKVINQRKGCGYYLPVGLLFAKFEGKKEEWKMKSGKTALVELVSYKKFSDPDDMVKESFWHQRGYKGEKLFKEMSFEEYLLMFQ